jgi:septal ring factor EnvC (AmiA/AmiB activator)
VRALVLLLLGLSSPAVSPRGSAPDERLRRVQERRATLERELQKLRGQERSLVGDVESLEVQVRLRGAQLRENELFLERANLQMDETLKRVRGLEKSVRETRPVLAARARALYKLGELSYVRILLSVDHPSDIFRGYRFVTALARRDNQRFAGFRADLAALTASRAELEKRTQEAMNLRTELERTRRSLEADRKRKTELLTSIVEEKELHAAYVQELEEAEGKLKDLLGGLGEGNVSVPLSAFKGSLPWPLTGRVRVPFGKRKHPKFDTYTIQNGIEIEASEGTRVAAIHDGSVAFADRFQGYGLMVILDHGGKHYSLYAHLGESAVQVGQAVSAGDVLGSVGSDPASLYFEIRFQSQPQDPLEWLAKPERRGAERPVGDAKGS